MKKRIIAFACLAAICFNLALIPTTYAAYPENAYSNQTTLRWTLFSAISLNMTFSSGTASCTGTLLGTSAVKRIEATFQLLKKNSSGGFDVEYTWPKATADSNVLTWSGSRTVTPGTYRLKVTAVATSTSNSSETVTTYCEKEYK